MSNIFFIGDLHFGHKNIIKFDAIKNYRIFSNIEAHNEEIICRWNAIVNRKDIVWVLGDFCFGKENIEIAARLNGLKKLVLGNHDTYQSAYYLKYFHKLYGAAEYDGCLLTHIPVHPQQLESRYKANIHGHLHSYAIPDERYICVSAEQINLTPISYDDIKNIKMQEKLINA